MAADPVFVLAAPYCGAARIAAMLGGHARATALPELHLFLADTVGALQRTHALSEARLDDGLLRCVAQSLWRAQNETTIAQARDWLDSRTRQSVAELCETLFERLAPRTPVLPDVSVGWRPHELDTLIERYPRARLIHLLRHPRPHGDAAVADLAGKLFVAPDWKDYNGGSARVDPQLAWLRINGNLGLCRRLGEARYRTLRLEDLHAAPEATLRALCDWLGWDSDSGDIASMLHPERSDYAGYGPPQAPFGMETDVLEQPGFEAAAAAPPSLDEPLPWRADAAPAAAEVVALARSFGYV